MQESIIQRAQSGDQRAFQQVVEEYHDIMWRTARVLLFERSAVEDAMQEAWIDVWRGLPRFNTDQPFRPWLLAIVANRCRMVLRHRSLPTCAIEDADMENQIGVDDSTNELLSSERVEELRALLAALPIEQQRVLELRFFAELMPTEIAMVLNIPIGTVKSRLNRALNALRADKRMQTLANATGEF